MKKVGITLAAISLLGGCALTHEQVVERAHKKTNTELCMALIQFPQYADVIEAELQDRGRVCDMQLAAAQVQEQSAQQAQYQAALQSAAASFKAQPTYQIQQPKPLAIAPVAASAPVAPMSATAYFTGRQQQVQTVTSQSGWSCEYRYTGQTFWRTFVGSCPPSVQVQ